MYSDKIKGEFAILRSEGWSILRISQHLHISRPTLIKWDHEFRFVIRSFRAVELEALQKSILQTQQEDLDRLSKQQKAVAKELSKRKLADISTENLFRLDALLRQEIQKARSASLLIEKEQTCTPQPEHPLHRYLPHAKTTSSATDAPASEPLQPEPPNQGASGRKRQHQIPRPRIPEGQRGYQNHLILNSSIPARKYRYLPIRRVKKTVNKL